MPREKHYAFVVMCKFCNKQNVLIVIFSSQTLGSLKQSAILIIGDWQFSTSALEKTLRTPTAGVVMLLSKSGESIQSQLLRLVVSDLKTTGVAQP